MEQNDNIKILYFELFINGFNNIKIGINIQKVVEIIQEPYITNVPRSFFPIIGQIKHQEHPIPILFLGHFFDQVWDNNSFDKKKRIIICEFQKILLGLIVDQTKRIITINNAQVMPIPKALEQKKNNLYNGIISYKNDFIHLLDIEQIIEHLNIIPDTIDSLHIEPKRFNGKTALVVEDSKVFLKKMIQTLSQYEINVISALDGEEGFHLYKNNVDKIDIIFTDIEMPKLNGISMMRKIKNMKEWKEIPVVFNSSISNPGLIQDIKDERLGKYCIKFNENEIFDVLKSSFFYL